MKFFKLLAFILIIAMLTSPVAAQSSFPPAEDLPPKELPIRPVPEELKAAFREGMSIEEFIRNYKGPIPRALWPYTDLPLTVIVELDDEPLVPRLKALAAEGEDLADVQKRHPEVTNAVKLQQDLLLDRIARTNTSFARMVHEADFSRYSLVLNGYRMSVPASQIASLEKVPGVKRVSIAREYLPNLAYSVPLIKADQVWSMIDGTTGYTGKGVTVAVIDTGIDYTHMMFGTTGNPALYANNDPTVIENGSFPTFKVVGGIDLAGTNYNASNRTDPAVYTPMPDPDPLDENGHGTHVASTVAGLNAGWGTGVAPDVELVAIKIFGANGSTNLVIDGIERAMDPNADGFINDKVDIANLSVGSAWGVADPDDPEMQAVENASAAGVFMAISAGNEGDNTYITGAPSVSDSAISVASTNTGQSALPWVSFSNLTGDPMKVHYLPTTNLVNSRIGTELVWAGSVMVNNDPRFCNLDDLSSPNAFQGKVALIQRGICTFETKLNNAQAAGAVFALVYNHLAGDRMSMAVGEATLASGFITSDEGVLLKDLAPVPVLVGTPADAEYIPSLSAVDTISDFSSRGPRGYDSKLKPEISAPGGGIFAAMIGSGNKGIAMSGTSMAAPHIAGVAALIKEAHPNWSVQEIKAALMNTAAPFAPNLVDLSRQGSGRVDALAAVSTQVLAIGDPKLVSLSWGLIELGPDAVESFPKSVQLKNWGDDATYAVTAEFTGPSLGAVINIGSTVTVPGHGGSARLDLDLTLDPSVIEYRYADHDYTLPVRLPNEYAGFINFTNTLDGKVLRLPFLAVVRPYATHTVTDSLTSMSPAMYGYVSFLRNSGNLPWSAETATVYMESPNDPLFKDAAEVRYVGMDYFGKDSHFGNIAIINFAQWGPVHSPQPYFAEIDMIVDVDQDGNADYSFFNFNELDIFGGGDANRWWLAVIDAETRTLAPANEYMPIFTDFNSGWQQWYIELDNFGIGGEATYLVANYDGLGGQKLVGQVDVNLLEEPLTVFVSSQLSMGPPEGFHMFFWTDDLGSYLRNRPLGVMLLDPYGKPGLGQASYFPVKATGYPIQYMPVISK